jgi:hypothetical protein
VEWPLASVFSAERIFDKGVWDWGCAFGSLPMRPGGVCVMYGVISTPTPGRATGRAMQKAGLLVHPSKDSSGGNRSKVARGVLCPNGPAPQNVGAALAEHW